MELRLTARTRSGSVHYLVLLPHAVERPTDFVNVFMIVPFPWPPAGGWLRDEPHLHGVGEASASQPASHLYDVSSNCDAESVGAWHVGGSRPSTSPLGAHESISVGRWSIVGPPVKYGRGANLRP